MLQAVLAIVLTLLLVVGIHEAGHAFVARLFKVKIKKISIGFGKPLIRIKTASGIEWIWALFPLGGYVQLLNSRIEPVKEKDYPNCFDKQPAYARVLILLAGVAANVLTAWLALFLVASVGIYQRPAVIGDVLTHGTAAQSGLKAGDKIIAVNQQPTVSWAQVAMHLLTHLGQEKVPLTLKNQQGDVRRIHLNLSDWQLSSGSLFDSLGFKPNSSEEPQRVVADSYFAAFSQASWQLFNISYYFIISLTLLITGMIPFSVLLGPVGLFAVSIQSMMQGFAVFLFFIAHFSLAVALVNSLPLPGLDGGSILYVFIEKIRGKPISVALEILLYRLTLIGFFVLLANLVANDLQQLA